MKRVIVQFVFMNEDRKNVSYMEGGKKKLVS